MATTRSLRVAVVGCAHGELDSMYAAIKREESTSGKVDLLLCCGDFQAVRNEGDLNALACPPKYRSMNSFWKYYSGEATAPCTTVFIGGNHEASNYLWELFYGGWVAPNIFYLGAAGVINFGGLRIGGLSGIYKPQDYHLGHFERPPYNEHHKRTVYHVREYDVHKLMQITEPIDIFLSHDWPRGIAHCGDTERLLKYKGFLRKEVEENTLGSDPGKKLLAKLKPCYWFSAHLHVKFAALVHHPAASSVTKFLALDKCLPGRGFLQIVDVPVASDAALEITYDKEWLSITRACHADFPSTRHASIQQHTDLHAHRNWIEQFDTVKLSPPPFQPTASFYNPANEPRPRDQPGHVKNPQTEAFLRLLELPYLLDSHASQLTQGVNCVALEDPNEIHLPSDDEI